jgi:probable phosphoglycerate mutase
VNAAALPYVCLVRHGETAWTLSGQHTGRTDIPLTARGEADARAVPARLAGLAFGAVFTSPLQRARRTCELAGYGPVSTVDDDLAEWDYGEYEGVRTSEIHERRPSWTAFEDGCPGGESSADVGARADRVIARARAAAGNVLLFGHRDLFRVLAARWIGLPPVEGRRFYMGTGALNLLGYDHSLAEPAIHLWNGWPNEREQR